MQQPGTWQRIYRPRLNFTKKYKKEITSETLRSCARVHRRLCEAQQSKMEKSQYNQRYPHAWSGANADKSR